jgi:hypothetical protein
VKERAPGYVVNSEVLFSDVGIVLKR